MARRLIPEKIRKMEVYPTLTTKRPSSIREKVSGGTRFRDLCRLSDQPRRGVRRRDHLLSSLLCPRQRQEFETSYIFKRLDEPLYV